VKLRFLSKCTKIQLMIF